MKFQHFSLEKQKCMEFHVCLNQQCTFASYTCQLYLNLSDIRIIQKNKLTKFMLSIYQAFYYFLLCKQYAFCVVLDKAFHVKSLGTNLIRGTLLLSALLQRDWASQTFLVMVVFSKCIFRGLSILKFQVGHSKKIIKAKSLNCKILTATELFPPWRPVQAGLMPSYFCNHNLAFKAIFSSYHGICHVSQLF